MHMVVTHAADVPSAVLQSIHGSVGGASLARGSLSRTVRRIRDSLIIDPQVRNFREETLLRTR